MFSNVCYDYFVYCILHANVIAAASTLSLYRINTDYNTRSFYKSMLLDCFCVRAASSFSYSPGRRAHRPSAGSQADRASPSGKTARSNSPPPEKQKPIRVESAGEIIHHDHRNARPAEMNDKMLHLKHRRHHRPHKGILWQNHRID